MESLVKLFMPVRPTNAYPATTISPSVFVAEPHQNAKMGLIMGDTESDCHLKRFLFQAAVSCAAQGQKNIILITSKPWTSFPIVPDSGQGVKGTPLVSSETVSALQFVYPKTPDELCQYLSALGGVTEASRLPDALLIDDLDLFIIHASNEENRQTMALHKILTIIRCVMLTSAQKRSFCRCLLTSTMRHACTKDLDRAAYKVWLDEVWRLTHRPSLSLTLNPNYVLAIEYNEASRTYDAKEVQQGASA